jgi:2,3-bisphosphoglycerate-dependent phosphoglycerate mutase
MRRICLLLLIIGGMSTLSAQTRTFILLRHAEKDTSTAGSAQMTADPPLTAKGKERAARLLQELKAYQPDAIYSTNYIRTRSTVQPLAEKFGMNIETYDPKNLKAFAESLLAGKAGTTIVAGHSNTTPALVNLLIGENRYAPLDDSVYNQYWIITITAGKPEAKVVTY